MEHQMLAPSFKFGTHTRLVLDIGGRTGSLSAAFEKRGVLTLTITDRESAQNGVQLILERGFSGLVQTLRAHRLPYPDQAFDLLHCADCSISWLDNGGLLLFEADRLVRAGGFIVLVNTRPQSHHWTGLMRLTTSICWELTAREGNLMIWQKPANKTCYLLHSATISHACDDDLNPSNAAWNASLTHCLVGSSTKKFEAVVDTWPARLISPPLRLQYVPTASIQKAKQESYLADFNYWQYVTSLYLKSFGTSRMRGIRNVIDMNAGYGGFAAALSLESSSKHWWILNVVPITGPDRLPVVFDRGLLGVYHNWCKALDIYPRTFDMLHASALFSTKLGCDMSEILFEMDRLLRPGGFALIRDTIETILQFDAIAKMLEWKTTISDTESGPMGTDKLLHCQKSFHSRRSQKRG